MDPIKNGDIPACYVSETQRVTLVFQAIGFLMGPRKKKHFFSGSTMPALKIHNYGAYTVPVGSECSIHCSCPMEILKL